jgi:hypothetical protein
MSPLFCQSLFVKSKRTIPLRKITPVIILLLFLTADHALAQFQRFSLPRSGSGTIQKSGSALGRTKEIAADTLPFWDDFSKPLASDDLQSLVPDTSRWEKNYSVWVNDGMGIHPPTINVATFDGLDESGEPYNRNEVLATGYTDTLTSKPLDLSETKISLAERPGVYLSFFYQWQGNVEAPDAKDFLQLDFKNADGWETVMTIYPKENPQSTIFYDTIIQISGEQFFHNKFQFRFTSFGRLSGPFDAWHVDYVYVNKNRNLDDLFFPDRALSTQLGPLFGRYRAIPRDHFFSNAQMTPPTFEIQNMKNEPASVNFRTEALFIHTDIGKDTLSESTVISNATPIKISNNVLLANEHLTARLDTLPDINDPLQFPVIPGIDSTLIRLTIALQTDDNVPSNTAGTPVEPDSTGDYTSNYLPIRFTSNDTLTSDYALSSYYAYDDGVAEYAAGLIEAGNLVAYEFGIDTTYALKQDTLVGFDIYFPPYGRTSNQTIDFFIYREEDGLPGAIWITRASVRIEDKGINEFQRVTFLPALLIDNPKFYIGWKEPVAGEIVVGVDMSNDTGDKIFVNTNDVWYQNEDVRGSLMIRPIFGSGIIDSSVGIEEEPGQFAVYPNPSQGSFYIDGEIGDIAIISLTGQKIPFESHAVEGRTEVQVHTQIPGLYILRYKAGTVLKTQKIIITR